MSLVAVVASLGRPHHGRIGLHQPGQRRPGFGGQQPPCRHDPDERFAFKHDDIVDRVEAPRLKRRAHRTGLVVRPRHGDALRRVLGRDAEERLRGHLPFRHTAILPSARPAGFRGFPHA